jgi:hypothetical protein
LPPQAIDAVAAGALPAKGDGDKLAMEVWLTGYDDMIDSNFSHK